MATTEPSTNVARSAGVLIAGRYGVAILGYAGTAIIARTLSPNAWGGYTLVFSILGILGLICDIRARRRIMNEVSDAGDDCGPIIGSYLVLRVFLAGAAYAVAMVIAVFGDYPSSVVAGMAVAGGTLLLAASWNAYFLMFQMRGWFQSYAVFTVIGQAAQLALTIALVVGHRETLVWLMWPSLAFDGTILIGVAAISRRYIHTTFRIEPKRWASWVKEAVPVTIGGALSTLYFRVDTVMLSRLDTLNAVGLYGIGYKFSDLIGYFAAAVTAPVLPLLVRSWPNDLPAFRAAYRASTILLAVLAIGVTIQFCVFAHPAIVLLYGSRFGATTAAARLLVIGRALNFFTVLYVYILIATDRNRLYPVATMSGLILNVVLNYVLIPRYSYVGSGWATIITEVVVIGVLVFAVKRLKALDPLPWIVFFRIGAAGAAMLAVAVVGDALGPWPVAAVLSGIVYLAALHGISVDGPGGLRALFRPIVTSTPEAEPVVEL